MVLRPCCLATIPIAWTMRLRESLCCWYSFEVMSFHFSLRVLELGGIFCEELWDELVSRGLS